MKSAAARRQHRTIRASAGFLLIAMGLLSACQRGIVPGNAYDQPLWSFSGSVLPTHTIPTTLTDPDGATHTTNPIMGLLWTDPLQRVADLPQPARGISSSLSIADGGTQANDTFQIDIYGPPPAEAMVDVPLAGGSSLRLALAEIVMIDDQNHDGTFEVSGSDATIGGSDSYIGSANTVLVYLDRSYASLPPGNVLAVSGDQGYQLVFYACDHQTITQVLAQNPAGGTVIFTQPSTTLPETRSCARTHSP